VSAFVDERRCDFGVELICKTLGVSASAYYQRATGQRSARVVEDERLLEVIKRTHTANYEAYGSRRMWKALRRQGESAPRCQVERLMAANAIVGAKRRGRPWRTTVQGAEAVTSPDLLDRDFSAARPDEKWCADFTYIRCWEGVVFFSFVIDCYSRMVVGWQFAGHMRTELVQDALDMAVGQRRPDHDALLIHHSDRGSQYTSAQFNDALDDHGVLASLGSTGDAYDNALAESFVDSFKTELIADRPWRTRSDLELAIVEWVGWFNHQRLHSSLDDVPPAEFEALYEIQYVLTPSLLISQGEET
jgi:transposase InsO family protein